MPLRRRRSGLRARVHHAVLPCAAVITLVASAVPRSDAAVAALTPTTGPATSVGLELDGPARAAVGQVVSFAVVARGAPDLGAYQADLRFDSAALAVVRVDPPKTLPGSGALTALSAVETPNHKVLAGWSCAGPGCARDRAAGGGALLTTVDVEALRPGRIELRIDGAQLVRRSGTLLATASTRAVLTAAAGSRTYAAPRGARGGTPPRHTRHTERANVDLNGDGAVTSLDVGALTAEWVAAAERNSPCVAPEPGTDVDGDGCMTIADLQSVAAWITSTPPGITPAGLRSDAITTFTVTSTGDGADTTADGVCFNKASGTCTLRAAIQEANRTAGPTAIAFAIPGTGLHTIAPASQLPSLNNPNGITIDGFTQHGAAPNTDPLVDNAVYRIELKGKGANGMNGLVVVNAGNLIRGLNMHGFNRAIWIYGSKATNNVVEGNMLGLTPTGGMDPGYTAVDSSNCVTVQQGATHTQIGAPGNANRNVVSGCNHQDIATYDYPTAYTTIQNNITGLDPTGKLRRAAKYHGIDINTGTEYTLVGGTGLEEHNLVSGNNREGIEISHYPTTVYNSVVGNFIGTDPTGNAAPSYAYNGLDGVHLEGEPSCNNAPCVPDAGFSTVTDNIIVSAHRDGVLVDKGVHDSVIAHNKIGLTANGTAGPNTLAGVNIQAGSTHITVGPGNEIANNPAGIEMQPDGVEPVNPPPTVTQYDTITQNSIHDNGNGGNEPFGIDLAPFGAVNTAANADPDVNEAIVAPVLSNPTSASVDATTCASCTVEVFVADHPADDHGSGRTYITTAVADSSGAVTVTLPASAIGAVITATATSPNGSTSEFSNNVLIPSPNPGNLPPTASFTPTCNGLACTFDGTASSDPDGTVVGYAWNFGDATSGTGESVQHNFSTPGTYTVELTVTDNDAATNSTSTQVDVADLAPTASFTGTCTANECSFDGSSSSDPDNPIQTYTWSFGDTSGGTGVTTSHAYAAAGDYTVTLTVDDGEGGASSTSEVFHADAPTNNVVASDDFTRTVATGWGAADLGGAYASAPGAAGASVNGSAGTYTLKAAATGGGQYLPAVSVLDSDTFVDVATSVAPAGGTWGQVAYLTARRVAANTEYRVRLRFMPSGVVRLSFVKVLGNSTEVVIGSEVTVTGLQYAANRVYALRFDVTGTSPTTLQAKAWVAGSAEPAVWTLTQTDSAAALQAAGSPGVRVFLGGSATSFPTWSFDALNVTALP